MNSKRIELQETKEGFDKRDLHSKAILNTSSDMLLKYKIQRVRAENMKNVAGEIEKIKSDISEIRELLLKLLADR
jgi:hypothetical protein